MIRGRIRQARGREPIDAETLALFERFAARGIDVTFDGGVIRFDKNRQRAYNQKRAGEGGGRVVDAP